MVYHLQMLDIFRNLFAIEKIKENKNNILHMDLQCEFWFSRGSRLSAWVSWGLLTLCVNQQLPGCIRFGFLWRCDGLDLIATKTKAQSEGVGLLRCRARSRGGQFQLLDLITAQAKAQAQGIGVVSLLRCTGCCRWRHRRGRAHRAEAPAVRRSAPRPRRGRTPF